jgi:hypothetical protein
MPWPHRGARALRRHAPRPPALLDCELPLTDRRIRGVAVTDVASPAAQRPLCWRRAIHAGASRPGQLRGSAVGNRRRPGRSHDIRQHFGPEWAGADRAAARTRRWCLPGAVLTEAASAAPARQCENVADWHPDTPTLSRTYRPDPLTERASDAERDGFRVGRYENTDAAELPLPRCRERDQWEAAAQRFLARSRAGEGGRRSARH